ncbi:hypothetical protein N8352_05350 [Porticoccaceae bacterium]|nr:hypothetical protein [Porticoccaceae bacterium]MDC0011387.1 hypothetical protein [Porticoccaceae bacterium]MDC1453704.1 hypothetical protein [Porticoccaceae bacterium]
MSDKKAKDAAGDAPENVLPTTPTEDLGAEDIASGANAESSDATAEKITETLEQLLPGVLEIAEATNTAADVNRKSAAALKKGLDQVKVQAEALNDASEKSAVLASRVMIGAVSALVISVFLYGFIAFQLASRVTQVDSMLVAVSKRVVQMNNALNTFEQLRSSIGQLAVTQAQFSDRQMLLIEAVSRSEVSTRSLAKEVPDLAAQKVGLKTDQIATQVSSLSDDLAGQSTVVSTLSKSVGALGQQMKSLEAQVSNVKKLNADVEALIALERENYLDVLQRQVAVEEARQAEGKPVEPEPAPSVVVYPYISISK